MIGQGSFDRERQLSAHPVDDLVPHGEELGDGVARGFVGGSRTCDLALDAGRVGGVFSAIESVVAIFAVPLRVNPVVLWFAGHMFGNV